jgi:hypothetical protein
MSSVVPVVVLAVASALLGVFLYGIPMGRMAVGPDSHVARHPLVAALWGFAVGAVVSVGGQALLGGHPFEAGELAMDLAGIPVVFAVGNYMAGRIARRRRVAGGDPLPSSRDVSD